MPPYIAGQKLSLLPVALGAMAFTAPQVWLFARAASSPNLVDGGWFLNSGAAVGTIAASVSVAALLVALIRNAHPMANAVALTVGAGIAMAITLALIGLGNLFPLVLA